jgi:hypothetical protein
MFNYCTLSGVVCGGLDLDCPRGEHARISFQLAIQSLLAPVGWIEIVCFSRDALLVAKYLRPGDRVAVVGFLVMNDWQSDAGEWHNDAEVIAIFLELVKGDAYTQR